MIAARAMHLPRRLESIGIGFVGGDSSDSSLSIPHSLCISLSFSLLKLAVNKLLVNSVDIKLCAKFCIEIHFHPHLLPLDLFNASIV